MLAHVHCWRRMFIVGIDAAVLSPPFPSLFCAFQPTQRGGSDDDMVTMEPKVPRPIAPGDIVSVRGGSARFEFTFLVDNDPPGAQGDAAAAAPAALASPPPPAPTTPDQPINNASDQPINNAADRAPPVAAVDPIDNGGDGGWIAKPTKVWIFVFL